MKIYAIYDNSFFQKKPYWMPRKLYRVVCQRSNPRSKEYMQNLLYENFPDIELVDFKHLSSSTKIILLYPDSIGLGWKKIETRLQAQAKEITVLNGRKRIFKLSFSVHKKLLLRRFLELTFLPEMFFTPFIFLYGISIFIKDKLYGCKS